jgi:C-terminal processing protease CtpA/Prc
MYAEVLVVNNIEKGGSADLDGTLKAGDIVLELEGVDVTTGHPIDIIEAILLGRTGCCPLNPTGNVSQVDWTE